MALPEKLQQIARRAYSTEETILNSYASVEAVNKANVPGVLVECGVGAGSQIAIMGLACIEQGVSREIWAYDSFQGIPLASAEDDLQPGIGVFHHDTSDKEKLLVSSGITVHDLPCVKQTITEAGIPLTGYKFIEGWFQHTLPHHKPGKIAVLRLDGDLYGSTRVCLEHLFPLLSSGGWLIIDDWVLKGCRQACDEYFKDYSQFTHTTPNSIPGSGPVYFIKK